MLTLRKNVGCKSGLGWFVRFVALGTLLVGLSWSAAAQVERASSEQGAEQAGAVESSPHSASVGRFVDRVFRDADGEHKYVVFVPPGYTPKKKWPVILFLHGAGERGKDGRKQTTVGLGPLVKARADRFPFFVVFPQCEDESSHVLGGWLAGTPDARRALKILQAVEQDYSIDRTREILTGWSMGGYGAWSLAAADPQRWHAVVPVAGGGDPKWAPKLKDVPIWAFHGAEDRAIPPKASREMVEAVRAAGGRPRYTEVPGVGHDVWKVVYDIDELYQWMLEPKPAEQLDVPLAVRPGQPKFEPEETEPFVPALEVPNAVFVRLGNDALAALAYALPLEVPEDALTGTVPDLYDSTVVQGRSFSVVFSNISYSARLTRAHAQAYAPGRLNVRLGLENLRLTIGTTYVTGPSQSAVAGPISVVAGYQGPVWLSLDLQPYVEQRRLKFKLLSVDFDIPWENYYVTSPAWVSVRGLGMTRGRVASGLVDGLYGARDRVEQQVEEAVPALLEKVEQNLDLSKAAGLVESFWPLPVYKPRVRLWASDVETDSEGVSLTLGVTAAAVKAEAAPPQPKLVTGLGQPAGRLPKVNGLRVGVAPGLLQPLTDLLIQADVARIHVKDIPEPQFAPLADPTFLAQAIPDLKRLGDVEVWSEVVLARPLQVRSVDGPQSRRFAFDLPKLLLSVAVRKKGQKQWQPYAEFEVHVWQAAESEVVRLDWEKRALRLKWVGQPKVDVHGRFAPGYKPADPTLRVEPIRDVFLKGWVAWTSQGPYSQTEVPDVQFGPCRLRLEDTGWWPPYLFVDFRTPTTRLTNDTGVAVRYQVKGPVGRWSEPYTLGPGETHAFEVPYPLTYRRISDTVSELYTLPVGSRCGFRVPKEGGEPRLFLVEGGSEQ